MQEIGPRRAGRFRGASLRKNAAEATFLFVNVNSDRNMGVKNMSGAEQMEHLLKLESKIILLFKN